MALGSKEDGGRLVVRFEEGRQGMRTQGGWRNVDKVWGKISWEGDGGQRMRATVKSIWRGPQ